MPDLTRRSVIRSAAWSVPVIAAAISTPLAAASTQPPTPARVDYLGNYGHGGSKGGGWWLVTYTDGSTRILDNGTVMSDPELKAMARKVRP